MIFCFLVPRRLSTFPLMAIALGFLFTSAMLPLRADTIAESTDGPFQLGFPLYVGQSFTSSAMGMTNNIVFNFFSNFPATDPYAQGTGFLFSTEYMGTPNGLISMALGFLGQATASGGFYTFDPNLTLLAGTQYFFYVDEQFAGASITGAGAYTGGQFYSSIAGNDPFSPSVLSANFRVTGTLAPTGVPENGPTILYLGVALLAFGRLRTLAAKRN